eukprot:scaffold13554_cov196-Alexandrium_tamarense.AAC.8
MSSKEGAVIITSTPSDSAGLIGHVFCPDPSNPDALSLIAYLEDTGCVVTHTAIDATLTQDAAIAQFSVANNGATVEYLVDLLQSSPVIFREGRLSLLHRQLQQEEYDHPSQSSFSDAVGNTPSRNPISSPPTWLLSRANASPRPHSTQPPSRLGVDPPDDGFVPQHSVLSPARSFWSAHSSGHTSVSSSSAARIQLERPSVLYNNQMSLQIYKLSKYT